MGCFVPGTGRSHGSGGRRSAEGTLPSSGYGEGAVAWIRSATAVRETISHPVRAVGIVVPEERRVGNQSKVEGWIEKCTSLHGQIVTKGQPPGDLLPGPRGDAA